MAEWVTKIVESMGLLGIGLLMFLENVFPPIPSEVVMPLAGFVAARGDLPFVGAVLAGTLGSVVGQLPLYYLGRRLGEERIKAFADRHSRWLLLDSGDVERAFGWFEEHGRRAVFICRLVPGVRSLISIPAGIRGMPLGPFLLWSTAGMGVWALALASAGRLLGQNYDAVSRFMGPASWLVLAAACAALAFLFVRRKRGMRENAGSANGGRQHG